MNLYTKTFANEDNAGNKVYMRIFFDEKDERQSANIHLKTDPWFSKVLSMK